ncbi:MAG: DUF411 domain-containing protein [Acidobacteria bacterium]|nr:DUF411 domain-containing protein [Acidobacteriota bacterium]
MGWAAHLQQKGFGIKTVESTNAELDAIKDKYGIPKSFRTCHTAVVGNYAIEGHVPADVLARFLKEKPAAAGIAVPGMPMGSPGMEGPNPQTYTVYLFDKEGRSRVYSIVQPEGAKTEGAKK